MGNSVGKEVESVGKYVSEQLSHRAPDDTVGPIDGPYDGTNDGTNDGAIDEVSL